MTLMGWFTEDQIFAEYGALNAIEKYNYYKRKVMKKRCKVKRGNSISLVKEPLLLNALLKNK